ncbi:hypothetical protein LOK74_11805 [Brevibacillus humidisoli]|uniref:hypothetical protein n=1 Tax=Brevibacillus humidisoli TaxID=2895522 RepID=UPI001E63CC10|nr:hypothetical protein [Brevibacillus humidisoli]UFJ43116.1 hypothetical protein LOK74_11805 [Brevibacillus humidisoli]
MTIICHQDSVADSDGIQNDCNRITNRMNRISTIMVLLLVSKIAITGTSLPRI